MVSFCIVSCTAWKQSGMPAVFFYMLFKRHSLCNEKKMKFSFFVPKIPTDMQSGQTWMD